ncbi:hypothetical protein, partial [Psychrobacillus vulpis]|uniref:hypothetical protein n=1 Tax=Psychrobacillus vulpis TaxID=2325572 RepID=UPI001981F224
DPTGACDEEAKFFARGKRAVSFGKLRGNYIKSETIWTFSVASGKGAVSTIFFFIGIMENTFFFNFKRKKTVSKLKNYLSLSTVRREVISSLLFFK